MTAQGFKASADVPGLSFVRAQHERTLAGESPYASGQLSLNRRAEAARMVRPIGVDPTLLTSSARTAWC